ncbi:uncharacterized protein BJX67DRAFT_354967 [Aspergillus lucknowensis]|uniref:Uncharacterized protein n=1 Tax=Aspergillus lucknowensis TaxID=176173 RepID=A0ABR4LPQ7_9EURO
MTLVRAVVSLGFWISVKWHLAYILLGLVMVLFLCCRQRSLFVHVGLPAQTFTPAEGHVFVTLAVSFTPDLFLRIFLCGGWELSYVVRMESATKI